MVTYRITIEPEALHSLGRITDRRVREMLRDRINGLAHDPEIQGKPLIGEFIGFRSLRAAGQRYRIIYKVERDQVIVFVVAVGLRKEGDKADVYLLAKKLIRLRLVE